MKKLFEKLQKFYYFHLANPVIRKGEKGGFKWQFRRFWLDISTLSGNFKCRLTASEHPYAYLYAGEGDENIAGFAQVLYFLSQTLTSDQGLVDDVTKAINKFVKRTENQKVEEEDEQIAIEEVKAVQEHIELPEKERKKEEKRINRQFRKATKKSR